MVVALVFLSRIIKWQKYLNTVCSTPCLCHHILRLCPVTSPDFVKDFSFGVIAPILVMKRGLRGASHIAIAIVTRVVMKSMKSKNPERCSRVPCSYTTGISRCAIIFLYPRISWYSLMSSDILVSPDILGYPGIH